MALYKFRIIIIIIISHLVHIIFVFLNHCILLWCFIWQIKDVNTALLIPVVCYSPVLCRYAYVFMANKTKIMKQNLW